MVLAFSQNAMEQRALTTVGQLKYQVSYPDLKLTGSEAPSSSNPSGEPHAQRRRRHTFSDNQGKPLPCNDLGTPFVSLLSACANSKDLRKGFLVHNDIAEKGLLKLFSAGLATMFAKCGDTLKAKELLELHKCKNIISWTALIAEYVRQGKGLEALNCFKQMQLMGLCPDAVTFACVLKACSILKATKKGEQIHHEIARQGLLLSDNVLGNALVDMYAKCGDFAKAQQVLDELPSQNVVSWNALITGYVLHNQGKQALLCFERMHHDGISPNVVTFTCILKACSCMKAVDKGAQIHDEIDKQDLLGKSIMLGTALVDMYAKCGALAKARSVLMGLPSRNVVAWNALITGYAQYGQGTEAMSCFNLMQREGLDPDVVTFNCMLKACGAVGALAKGEEIHEQILRQGLLRNNLMLGNALVDMYAKCGALPKARQVLEELPTRDVVTWNALIGGFIQQGQGDAALNCFDQMQLEGTPSDVVTFASALKACGILGDIARGKQIYDHIDKQGLLGMDCMLGNAVVDMYVKCGNLVKAQDVLKKLPCRDVVTWSALIAGFAQAGQGEAALDCFQQMQCEGLSPDAVTFTCLLKACGSIGAVDIGEQIHDEIAKQGFLKSNVILRNALVDMYAKSGALTKAQEVLEELPFRNVVCWSSLIAGYAQQGQYEQTLTCFKQMLRESIQPDAIAIACVLNACCHLGLEEEGHEYFSSMSRKYDIKPDLEHYTAMVDLFGRAGHLDQAVRVIQEMSSPYYYIVWKALLGACHKWGDVIVGRWAFEKAIQVDKSDTAVYVLMANIYAAAGMHMDAENIEDMKKANKACEKICTKKFRNTVLPPGTIVFEDIKPGSRILYSD